MTGPEPWGKYAGQGAPLPLRSHLLDTAACAGALWDSWLRTGLQQQLADGIADGDLEVARSRVMLIAGVHDVGKATAVFQGQLLAKGPQDPAFARILAEFERAGYVSPGIDSVIRESSRVASGKGLRRHEVASFACLSRSGMMPTTGDEVADDWVATVAGGHHGVWHAFDPDADSQLPTWLRQATGGAWGELQRQLIREVETSVGASLADLERNLHERTGTLTLLLTGFVMLADWFASSSPCEPTASFNRRCQAYADLLPTTVGIPVALDRARERVLGSFADSPRPVQVAAEENAADLLIISETTGSGKTEAALLRHSQFGPVGLMFSLPTRATANAMWQRVRGAFAGIPIAAELLHEYRSLDAFYEAPAGMVHDDVYRTEWLASSRHALLAPLTVGTVDQVLVGALRRRYLPIRLLALANRHVVLDEVHTLDPYQQVLLERLLNWWGRTGTPVTLLSATIPERARQRWADAYRMGASPLVIRSRRRSRHAESFAPAAGIGHYPGLTSVTLTVQELQKTRDGGHGPSPQGHSATPQVCVTARETAQPLDTARRYVLGVQIHEIEIDAAFIAEAQRLHDTIRGEQEDAVIGIVVNRIDAAISIGRALLEAGETVLVIHSRMTAAHRERVAQELAARLGRGGCRGRLTVVGTQVIEASLDIDVDVLITELAPAPALLQRAGRLWRHSTPLAAGDWRHATSLRRGRPECHVLARSNGGVVRPDALPYTLFELQRTLDALVRVSGSIRIPEDVQALVDEAYFNVSDIDEYLEQGMKMPDIADALRRERQRVMRAADVAVPFGGPSDETRSPYLQHEHLAELTTVANVDSDDVNGTRFDDTPTFTVLLCNAAAEGAWGAGVEEALISRDPEVIRQVMRGTLPVSAVVLGRALVEIPVRDGLLRAPQQRRIVPVTIHPGATYHPVLGLCPPVEHDDSPRPA